MTIKQDTFKVTLSAFRASNNLVVNFFNHKELQNGLRNLGLKPYEVVGYYKEQGEDVASYELSLAVTGVTWEQLEAIYNLALNYKQDSILVESTGEVILVYVTESVDKDLSGLVFCDTELLGSNMVEVSQKEMEDNGAGTIVNGNKYYIVK